MSDGYYNPVNPLEKFPNLIVLGAGNTVTGIAEQTIQNARVAADLVVAGQAPADLIMAAGLGPKKNVDYPESEADGIARIISEQTDSHGINPSIIIESMSHETIGNAEGLLPHIQQSGIEAFSVVAAIGHVDRFCHIASRLLPEVEFVPIPSIASTSDMAVKKEAVLRFAYETATFGVADGDIDRLLDRHHYYRIGIGAAKWPALKAKYAIERVKYGEPSQSRYG